jgi:hypothetical protein
MTKTHSPSCARSVWLIGVSRRYPASDAEDHKFRPVWRGDADEADQARPSSMSSGVDFWVQTLNKSRARDGLFFNACRPMMLRSKKEKMGNGGAGLQTGVYHAQIVCRFLVQ